MWGSINCTLIFIKHFFDVSWHVGEHKKEELNLDSSNIAWCFVTIPIVTPTVQWKGKVMIIIYNHATEKCIEISNAFLFDTQQSSSRSWKLTIFSQFQIANTNCTFVTIHKVIRPGQPIDGVSKVILSNKKYIFPNLPKISFVLTKKCKTQNEQQ